MGTDAIHLGCNDQVIALPSLGQGFGGDTLVPGTTCQHGRILIFCTNAAEYGGVNHLMRALVTGSREAWSLAAVMFSLVTSIACTYRQQW
jgi:hypothetical protein